MDNERGTSDRLLAVIIDVASNGADLAALAKTLRDGVFASLDASGVTAMSPEILGTFPEMKAARLLDAIAKARDGSVARILQTYYDIEQAAHTDRDEPRELVGASFESVDAARASMARRALPASACVVRVTLVAERLAT